MTPAERFIVFVCIAAWLWVYTRQKIREVIVTERIHGLRQAHEAAMSAIPQAMNRGVEIGRTQILLELVLLGHRLVITQPPKGMTTEEAQAKVDGIFAVLQDVKRPNPQA